MNKSEKQGAGEGENKPQEPPREIGTPNMDRCVQVLARLWAKRQAAQDNEEAA